MSPERISVGEERQDHPQTPSTGLRRHSLEEGAGKRCSECGSFHVARQKTEKAQEPTMQRNLEAKNINHRDKAE